MDDDEIIGGIRRAVGLNAASLMEGLNDEMMGGVADVIDSSRALYDRFIGLGVGEREAAAWVAGLTTAVLIRCVAPDVE